MESQEIKSLKSKVKPNQLQKAKETLQSEIEQSKQHSLELRKSFDLLKSKNALRSLQLKKRFEEASCYLSEIRLSWKSESLNLKNSIEIFQVNQLKKRLAKEKTFEEILRLMSFFSLSDEHEKENLYKNNSYQQLESTCNWSESTLNQTLMKTVDSIKEKLKNYSSFSEGNTLTAVEEKIEMSFDTNMEFSDETSEEPRVTQSDERLEKTEKSEKIEKVQESPRKSPVDKKLKNSEIKDNFTSSIHLDEKILPSPFKLEWSPFNEKSSRTAKAESLENDSPNQLKSSRNSQKNHLKYLITEGLSVSARDFEAPKSPSQDEDTIIGLICDPSQIMTTLAIPTQGEGLNSSQKGSSYLISDSEALEKTQEIEVKRKTWKSWLCPCIFKTF
jgi:hypothetical protein